MIRLRTCIWDMETTDLKAPFGRIICAVVKEYHRRAPEIFVSDVVDGHLDDDKIVVALKRKLESYDIIVTHYGKGFDIPFLNSKLLLLNLEKLAPRFHVDTYYISRHTGKRAIARKSLEHLADVLGCSDQKMKVRCKTWNDARDAQDDAVKVIIDRCGSDVLLTEEVYSRLLSCGWVSTLKRV